MAPGGFLNGVAGSRQGTCNRALRAGALALLGLLAAAALEGPATFLEAVATRSAPSAAPPRGAAPHPAARLESWAGRAGPTEGAEHGRPSFVAGALAFLAAALIAFGSPDRAAAGLLSDFGDVDYEKEMIKESKATRMRRQQSNQSKVLDIASEKAKEAAKQKEALLAERQRAAESFKKLDEQKRAKEAAEAAKDKRVEEQRAKILAAIEQKAASGGGDEASAKAGALFQKFQASKAETEAAKEAEARKQEELRAQVLGDLEKRKSDAKKAAEEAEAIAKRIEELAKSARSAALLAKQSADALSAAQ